MSASSIAPKTHPLTGLPIYPMEFVGKNGHTRVVWPALGAEDNEGNQSDGGAVPPGGTGNTGTGGTGPEDTSGATSTGTAEKDPVKLAAMAKDANDQAARERHAKKAAEATAAEALAKLKAIEDKDKSELELAKSNLEELKAKTEKYEAAIQELRIQNAFLGSNKHQWQNGTSALKLADLSDVKIDEDGKVTGLEKALERLAKDHSYLLKPDANAAGGTAGGTGKVPASGANVGSTGSGQPVKDSRAAIGARFPAATRRR